LLDPGAVTDVIGLALLGAVHLIQTAVSQNKGVPKAKKT
jgi:hypothetical protein